MPELPSRSDLMGATQELLARLSPDMRDLLRELLLHKSLFVGEAFVGLASKGDLEEARTFRRIFDETIEQGNTASKCIEQWGRMHADPERVERVADEVRRSLLDAMILLKELSTEAFLAAAMAAPTKQLRDDLIRLADLDRMHADDLRAVIGASTIAQRLRKDEAETPAGACGAHAGRYLDGSLGRSIERTIERLAARGSRSSRLVLSSESYRHLRDEGHIQENFAFGLPIDLELGWTGETFALITRDRSTLAEILTATAMGVDKDRTDMEDRPLERRVEDR